MKKIKINTARSITAEDELSKREIKWDIPADLDYKRKGKVLVGIGRWSNSEKTFVIIRSAKEEYIYIEKPVWLEITGSLKKY